VCVQPPRHLRRLHTGTNATGAGRQSYGWGVSHSAARPATTGTKAAGTSPARSPRSPDSRSRLVRSLVTCTLRRPPLHATLSARPQRGSMRSDHPPACGSGRAARLPGAKALAGAAWAVAHSPRQKGSGRCWPPAGTASPHGRTRRQGPVACIGNACGTRRPTSAAAMQHIHRLVRRIELTTLLRPRPVSSVKLEKWGA